MNKKQFSFALLCAALTTVLINFSSCEKDKGTPPNISFITTPGFVYKDTTIAHGTTFFIGVTSTPAESGDVLKTMNLSKSVNGAADATVKTTTIPTAQQNAYNEIDTLTTGTAGTTEKYTFTVTNRDGITNNVKATVTVN
jgi:hypothetical protein